MGGRMNSRPSEDHLRVSVVIPALNEGLNLPHVLARLPPSVFEVIVVDGHSTDDTAAAARAAFPGVTVVTQDGRGKGNALRCGFGMCRGDIIVALDADGSTDPAEIPLFVAALRCGADLAKGSRFACGAGSVDLTVTRRIGNRLLTVLVNLAFRARFSDLCYGYLAFWTMHLGQLSPDCAGFEIEAQLNLRACRSGLRICEVPSLEYGRMHGASNLRAFRDGWRVLVTIARERLRHRVVMAKVTEVAGASAEEIKT